MTVSTDNRATAAVRRRGGVRPQGPSDDMLVLAATLAADEWVWAEDLRSTLHQLGFRLSSQSLVGALRRLAAEECPMFERRPVEWARLAEYRVTSFGRCQLGNHFPRARALERR